MRASPRPPNSYSSASSFRHRTRALIQFGSIRPRNKERASFRSLLLKIAHVLFCGFLALQPVTVRGQRNKVLRTATVTINFKPGHPANRFSPWHALGAAVDGHDKGVIDLQLTAPNIRTMLSAGFKSLGYRLRTELANDAWHWNSHGQWSDANNSRGYWTSDYKSAGPIELSYGYRLPRRGNTIDQANDDGYSRLDDGDKQSFWKSNPYLDRAFTAESNSLHPQWIVIEFEKPEPVNTLRLVWAEPFATRYQIQYANFDDVSDIALSPPGTWQEFPRGVIRDGRGGDVSHRLSAMPIRARWLRILMTESSQTTLPGTDSRDRLGFAVRELYAGVTDGKCQFRDLIRHSASRHGQTIIHVSSTDPWHRGSDLDEGVEQAGFDRIFRDGLTNGRPMLLPTGLLYDEPENAANEIRFLRARGYSFDRVELGEEPDGQYITPEDFGALYLEWADAIHRVDPDLKLGGPSFQEIIPADAASRVRLGNSAWLARFLEYLKRRGRSSDYSFFSFEWYPFDDVCEPVAPQLASAPGLLADSLHDMERRGLSRQIPWIISEYGYSAFATRAEISIEGALLNADIVGKFLELGGDQAFLFGYTPGYVDRDFPCTAGNNMLFSMDDDGTVSHRFATYFGARLLTQEWLLPGDGVHEIYPATSNVHNAGGEELITAYAVRRPDGLWAVLLINKDPKRGYSVSVGFRSPSRREVSMFKGQVDLFQFSGAQYQLNSDSNNPSPIKAEPPEHRVIRSLESTVALPPYSLTVVRGVLSR
jgi:F5/8 type C domain-containing protein